MKRIVGIFSFLFVSAFLMMLFSSKLVSANYEDSKNYVSITAIKGEDDKLRLRFSVTYQRGFYNEGAQYLICLQGGNQKIDDPSFCGGSDSSNPIQGNGWEDFASGDPKNYIATQDASIVDRNLTTKNFEVSTNIALSSDAKYNTYVVFVFAEFCSVRTADEYGIYNSCYRAYKPANYGKKPYTKLEFKVDDILNFGNVTDIEDDDLQTTMDKVSDIVYNTVMPIIYAVLGLFLVVRGAILGIQIVKSADNPQVRQEKIGAIKWLVIGVAVAFLAAGVVQAVAGFLSGALNF